MPVLYHMLLSKGLFRGLADTQGMGFFFAAFPLADHNRAKSPASFYRVGKYVVCALPI